ncbi:MAG TPA: ABC transporter permease subunit [Caldithrix sp.]|nr:ABC transporter permease subunit [Caldithrix sp.]
MSISTNEQFRKKVDRANKTARIIISFGGYGVIISIIFILLFLMYQSLPLSFSVSIKEMLSFSYDKPDKRIIAIGLDQYQEVYYVLNDKGYVEFYRLSDKVLLLRDSVGLNKDEKILSISKGDYLKDRFAVGTNSGRIIQAEIRMLPEYGKQDRTIVPHFKVKDIYQAEIPTDSIPAHIEELVFRQNDDYDFYVWINHAQELMLRITDDYDEYRKDLTEFLGESKLTKLEMDYNAEKLIAGTISGELFWFDISDPEEVYLKDNWKVSDSPVSSLAFLIGSNTIIIGNTDGQVTGYFPTRTLDNVFRFMPVYSFDTHAAAVEQIYISPRNRTFLTIDSHGKAHLNYSTTNQTQIEFKPFDNTVQAGAIAPKSDGIILIDSKNQIGHYKLEDEHPEATLQTLFGKVWYEGYEKPEFVWQSTGGSDEFEPKFSLIPLIFGTLKGTLYAMLFSIPLALLAAIYVSQFSPKWLSSVIKPTVEIMAALPSVVIGFLAGLYFSPIFEENLMAIFLVSIVVPVVSLFGIMGWRLVPEVQRMRMPLGWELILTFALFIISVWLSFSLADTIENLFFAGNIKQWLYDAWNINYDQRNSLVVGFALGFAVIPIIFTISEDALSNVPDSLTSASLALGASRWQTVYRVVIPAAAGGIFAAVMLGLGRAIGETMIVLMATGNTPILDLSPFNGFRAMSACIAVEIPEAPVGGTLYRILFLTAFLLFIFTFLINSIAARISDKLRKKYARF